MVLKLIFNPCHYITCENLSQNLILCVRTLFFFYRYTFLLPIMLIHTLVWSVLSSSITSVLKLYKILTLFTLHKVQNSKEKYIHTTLFIAIFPF